MVFYIVHLLRGIITLALTSVSLARSSPQQNGFPPPSPSCRAYKDVCAHSSSLFGSSAGSNFHSRKLTSLINQRAMEEVTHHLPVSG